MAIHNSSTNLWRELYYVLLSARYMYLRNSG